MKEDVIKKLEALREELLEDVGLYVETRSTEYANGIMYAVHTIDHYIDQIKAS